MSDNARFWLTLPLALSVGMIAGTFLAFSTFVMASLARVPAHAGIVAMQSINVVIVRTPFIVLFLASAVVSVVLLTASLWSSMGAPAAFRLAGCVLYLLGNIGTTAFCNVPLNNRLAELDPDGPNSANVWLAYVSRWTAWNHVRTISGVFAALSLTLSLLS
jgi:uncharacterized membrane protein